MSKLSEDIAYLKGKIDTSEFNTAAHREWEINQMNKIESYLKEHNGRLSKAENSINRIQGIGIFLGGLIGYILNSVRRII